MAATPDGDSVFLNGDIRIDGLVQGGSWVFSPGSRDLTYSWHSSDGLEWSTAWKDAVAAVFQAWGAVANINLVPTANAPSWDREHPAAGDLAVLLIREGGSLDALATGMFPDEEFADLILEGEGRTRTDYARPEGDIDVFGGYTPVFGMGMPFGGLGFSVLLHELGHALGLKHPHDDGGNGRPLLTGQGPNGIDWDSGLWTVMSYNSPYESEIDVGKAITPMPLDILAIQYIYGANMTYHTGNDTYVLRNDRMIKTIWDAGGNDTINVEQSTQGLTFELSGGSFIHMFTAGSNVGSHTAIAYNVTIENAMGSRYNDHITGNAAANLLNGSDGHDTLRGLQGNDTLVGGLGVDTLVGGIGNDVFNVDRAGDIIQELVGEGTDTVAASASFSIATLTNVENITLTGNANINATGNALNNTLTGNAGYNILTGGQGNDVYIVGSGDRVVEYLNGGNDIVSSNVTYNFTALGISNVETLLLGGVGAINGYGNGAANTIRGNQSANILDGKAGADVLIGQGGNDSYFVDNAGDTTTELTGQGVDIVYSSVSHVLQAFVENLTLTGAASSATGNNLGNTITGNAGNNFLNGGTGYDHLYGAGGIDRFVFDTVLNAATNVDTVHGFGADDFIVLDDDIFTAFTGSAVLIAAQFAVGAAATTAAHRIIFNSTTGQLFYDADGNGGGAQVQFADIDAFTALGYQDFSVVA